MAQGMTLQLTDRFGDYRGTLIFGRELSRGRFGMGCRERQGGTIDTIPLPRRLGAIVKNMSQVSLTFCTMDFRPDATHACILLPSNIGFHCWLEITGPSRAAVELMLRREQFSPAADTLIFSDIVIVPISSSKRLFGPLLAGYMILLWSEFRFVVDLVIENVCVYMYVCV